jgi:hypothetical protein
MVGYLRIKCMHLMRAASCKGRTCLMTACLQHGLLQGGGASASRQLPATAGHLLSWQVRKHQHAQHCIWRDCAG